MIPKVLSKRLPLNDYALNTYPVYNLLKLECNVDPQMGDDNLGFN